MSVLVVVTNADEAAPLVRWGARFARARRTRLEVLYPARGTKPSEAVELLLDDTEDQHPVRKALRAAVIESDHLFSDEKEDEEAPPQPTQEAPLQEAPPHPITGRARPTGRLRCSYCHQSLKDRETQRCPECFTRLHVDCWEKAGGCPTLGCSLRSEAREETRPQRSEWITLRGVTHTSRIEAVMAEIEERDVDLVVAGQHAQVRDEEKRDLSLQVMDKAVDCDAMLLRAAGNSGVRCERILAPAAGGPHAEVSLKLAEAMAKDEDGVLVPLFVEPDVGAEVDARAVGEHMLLKALSSAGVHHSRWVVPEVVLANSPTEGIAECARGGNYDLLLVGASNEGFTKRVLFGTIPDKLLSGEGAMAVAVVRRRRALTTKAKEALTALVQRWIPQLSREDRISLFERLQLGSRFDIDFFSLISLSTGIAALGLIQNSGAVVIGAMLVAPLMTPMIGAGLGLVQGNVVLVRDASRSIALGFLTAVLIGYLIGLAAGGAIPGRGLTDELLARGSPNVLDLFVAFLSGVAAAYAVARPNLSGALPGVAIAAALVPPIGTVGISFAQGAYANGQGAAALFGTNLVAIVLGAALAFRALGVHARKDQRGVVWAHRLQLGLILTSVVIAIPLVSTLLGAVTKAKDAFKVTPGLREEIRHEIEQVPGMSLVTLVALPSATDGEHHLKVVVASPIPPSKSLASELAAVAGEVSGKEIRVHLVGLRYEWSSESQAPPAPPGSR